MLSRRLTYVLLLFSLTLVACDATPSDPLDPRGDLAALLSVDGAAGQPSPHTLQGLLHAAVHRVYTEQGATAARSLVSELRRLQEDERAALARGERERAQALQRAMHAEQLSIVLRVFGRDVVERVITGVTLDAQRLARGIGEAETAGRSTPRGRELLATIETLLAGASTRAAEGALLPALDAATRAAAHAESLRHVLADARRIPGLQDLFELAVAHLRAELGPDATREALTHYNALKRAADAAVRGGDRQRAHRALEAVRGEQIRVVLHVLGSDAVARLLDALERGSAEVHTALAEARAAGRDVSRLERMAATARDMILRAGTAFADGDAASALELSSHAAGLINSVRLALTFR